MSSSAGDHSQSSWAFLQHTLSVPSPCALNPFPTSRLLCASQPLGSPISRAQPVSARDHLKKTFTIPQCTLASLPLPNPPWPVYHSPIHPWPVYHSPIHSRQSTTPQPTPDSLPLPSLPQRILELPALCFHQQPFLSACHLMLSAVPGDNHKVTSKKPINLQYYN